MKRIPWVTLIVAGAALAAWRIGIPAYDRAAIAQGETWRLITGHLAHWTSGHLCWDVLAFMALGVYCERERGSVVFTAVLLTAALTVSAILYLGCPEVAEYRGLSAIDSALWCWAAFLIAPRSLHIAVLLVSLFAVKLMAEVSGGMPLFVPMADAVRVLPLVHFTGGIAGVSAAVVLRIVDAPKVSPGLA